MSTFGTLLVAQTDNATQSPYSLFGLGLERYPTAGKSSGMAGTGISLYSDLNDINLSNPAAFATIKEKSFIMDAGLYTQLESFNNGEETNSKYTTNFSNLVLAYNANGKYGLGLSLTPATNVGYSLTGLENTIEGSNETYSTFVSGSGGLSDLRVDYGRPLLKNLNVGLRFSYLFGKIDETENVLTSSTLLTIAKSNYYTGAKFGIGAQYKLLDNYNFGFVLESPTTLSSNNTTTTTKSTETVTTIIEETSNAAADNFKLPLKIGFGFSTAYKNFLFAVDYKKNFWTDTNQSDALGSYTDQNIFSMGAEYLKREDSYKYLDRISYRAGINYDTGYLKINDRNVSSQSFSLGIGLPLDTKGTKINLSYTYKNSGSVENILIQENVNTVNIGLSLSDMWFVKRKYN